MLSVHNDFQLTQDSLAVWLTDLDVLLTNIEHLSEAPLHDKLRQLNVNFDFCLIIEKFLLFISFFFFF